MPFRKRSIFTPYKHTVNINRSDDKSYLIFDRRRNYFHRNNKDTTWKRMLFYFIVIVMNVWYHKCYRKDTDVIVSYETKNDNDKVINTEVVGNEHKEDQSDDHDL